MRIACILNAYLSYIEVNVKKAIDFKESEILIQQYADKYCEGNFSMAVRILIKIALKKDSKK